MFTMSPPSRGAWIEMPKLVSRSAINTRRPPRGGRGLKLQGEAPAADVVASPPSRGAWIEITKNFRKANGTRRRPPRGGRGLKCKLLISIRSCVIVAPLAGGVD